MNCHDVNEKTVPYLELDVTSAAAREVTDHLEHCGACRIEMEAVRQVLIGLKGRTVPDPGDSFWEHFPGRVRQALAPRRRTLSKMSWPSALAASLAFIMGAWIFTGLHDGGGRSQVASKPTSSEHIAAQPDLPDLSQVDWEREWEDDDPDILLTNLARRLDRATVDRLFSDI